MKIWNLILLGACLALVGYTRIPRGGLYVDLDTPCAHHWMMDDNTSSEVILDSKNATGSGSLFNNGSWQYTNAASTPHHVTGLVGGAIDFDGSNDWIKLPTGGYSFGSSTFAVSFWFKSTQAAIAVIYADQGDDGGGVLNSVVQVYLTADGKVNALIRDREADAISLSSTSAYNDGNWHHVVVSRTASTGGSLIVDLTEKTGTNASLGVINNNNGYLPHIGGTSYNTPYYAFAGYVDDLRIISRSLTDQEIRWLYNGGNGREDRTGSF